MPAEWEPQDGILMAWPSARSDWSPILAEARGTFARIAAEISRRERLLLVVAGRVADARAHLKVAGADLSRVQFHAAPLNDTWTRDFGPITVIEDGGRPLLLDFAFNGWGKKFRATEDNRVTKCLHEQGAFGLSKRRQVRLVLEGGSIESDGAGTILTTSQCLLSPMRNPRLRQDQIEDALRQWLGAKRILWLDHGHLEGDDTDAHIDTLARLCSPDTLAYQACDDKSDPHYRALRAMERQLRTLRTPSGRKYRLAPLPWPRACYAEDGRRLPATYANFLILNGAVLVPAYRDVVRDRAARKVLRAVFPRRKIVGVDCRALVEQHGSLHCVTMQLPKGVLP